MAPASPAYPLSGVFCLEGAWDSDDLTDRSSVLPVLELLERLPALDRKAKRHQPLISFIHRDVGTRYELEHYLERWLDENPPYQVLYLAFHGSTDGIWLSDNEGEVSLELLADLLANSLEGHVVFFGSCSVMSASAERLRGFLKRTKATAVLGYTDDVLWLDSAAMDMIVLGTLASYKRAGDALNRLENTPLYRGFREPPVGFSVIRR